MWFIKYCLLLIIVNEAAFGFARQDTSASLSDTSLIPVKTSSTTIAKGFNPYIIPTLLIAYGAFGLEVKPLQELNRSIQHQIVTGYPNFSTHVDDYLWMVPTVELYGLNSFGIHERHDFRDRTLIVLISNAIMEAGSVITKKTVREMRLDGRD